MHAVPFHRFRPALASAALALLASPALAWPQDSTTPKPDDNDIRVFWKDSLRFETRSKKFKLRLGGRLHADLQLADEDSSDVPKVRDGVEFRRARLYLSGELYQNLEFKLQYEFAGFERSSVGVGSSDANGDGNADAGSIPSSVTVTDGAPDFKDIYIGVKDFYGLGSLRIGQFKEPIGLEQLTSSNHITFVERALPSALAGGRSTGIMYRNRWGEDGDNGATFAAGVFRDADNRGNEVADGDWVYTGRLTGVLHPGGADDTNNLIHVGAGATRRQGDSFRFRSRPEIHLGPRFVDTRSISADRAAAYNVEIASVFGPLSLQAEAVKTVVEGRGATSNFEGDGWYAMATYMLTGESRRYDYANAVFKGPKVKDGWNGQTGTGSGAWELAARVSNLDLDDIDSATSTANGGELMNYSVGLNWYMTANHRLMLNYIHADLDNEPATADGELDAFLLRFQMAF